jgi:hypothetical protein
MPSYRRGQQGSLDVTKPLRKALVALQAENERIERQITAIQRALSVLSGKPEPERVGRATRQAFPRRAMSAKARKALSQRMTAYWAQRRREAVKARVMKGK